MPTPGLDVTVFLRLDSRKFLCPLTRLGGSIDFGDSKIVWDPRRSPVFGTRSSEPMHSIRANLFWATLLFPVAGFGWKPFNGRAWIDQDLAVCIVACKGHAQMQFVRLYCLVYQSLLAESKDDLLEAFCAAWDENKKQENNAELRAGCVKGAQKEQRSPK